MQSYTAYGFGSQIGITICALHNLPRIKKPLAIEILRQGESRQCLGLAYARNVRYRENCRSVVFRNGEQILLVLVFLETDRSHPIVTRLAVRVNIGQCHHMVISSEFLDLFHRVANVFCSSVVFYLYANLNICHIRVSDNMLDTLL